MVITLDIRQASTADVDNILEIYQQARTFMRQQGNLKQWTNGYPSKELVERDIQNNNCYVCTENQEIIGVFCYFEGPDPTYLNIYEGQWLNDEPYGVIHRIAVISHRKGIANACYDFALKRCKNLRIDTHEDNIPMQRSLAKTGFQKCGTIYLASGDPRIAFEKTIN